MFLLSDFEKQLTPEQIIKFGEIPLSFLIRNCISVIDRSYLNPRTLSQLNQGNEINIETPMLQELNMKISERKEKREDILENSIRAANPEFQIIGVAHALVSPLNGAKGYISERPLISRIRNLDPRIVYLIDADQIS